MHFPISDNHPAVVLFDSVRNMVEADLQRSQKKYFYTLVLCGSKLENSLPTVFIACDTPETLHLTFVMPPGLELLVVKDGN